MSFLRFRRRRGDDILAADWNAVLTELDRRLGMPQLGGGRRVRRSSSGGPVAFEVSLVQAQGKWEARFERGLIAGYEPVINKIKISDTDPATKQPPALLIDPAKDIDGTTGTGYVYARLNLRQDWSIDSIEPVCLPKPPDAAARKWKAFKLLALLTRTSAADPDAPLESWQAVEHNLGWAVVQKRSSGAARHIFWATS